MSDCDDVQYTDNSDRRPGTPYCGHCGYTLDVCDCHDEDAQETP